MISFLVVQLLLAAVYGFVLCVPRNTRNFSRMDGAMLWTLRITSPLETIDYESPRIGKSFCSNSNARNNKFRRRFVSATRECSNHDAAETGNAVQGSSWWNPDRNENLQTNPAEYNSDRSTEGPHYRALNTDHQHKQKQPVLKQINQMYQVNHHSIKFDEHDTHDWQRQANKKHATALATVCKGPYAGDLPPDGLPKGESRS